LLTKQHQINSEKRRQWRVLTAWIVAVELLLVLALFCWRWGLPAQSARVVVAKYAVQDHLDTTAAVRDLGGSRRAARCLALYFKLPARLAPHRLTATKILSACGRHGLGIMIRLRDDPNFEVRQEIVHGLNNIDDERVIWPLLGLLHDSNDDVRCAAGYALGERGDARAVPGLIKIVENDPAHMSLIATVGALGDLGDKSAIEPLKTLLDNEEYHVRLAAQEALRKLGVPKAERKAHDPRSVVRYLSR
jgi:HEAT repeats/PBS lyase HEAT-like repeat